MLPHRHNPSPLHGAQAVTGRTYTATYDAAGNMVCRAPNSTLTCAAGQTPTGQQLGYDAAGRLTSWQDGTEQPPNVALIYAYDGEGSRVAQHVVSFGSAWTTAYLLGDTAETTEGSGTFTDYLVVPGVGTAVETNSPSSPALSYLATDGLNSVSVALDALGNVSGQALYLPYGPGRYVSGRFPTTHGFTGQDQDSNTTGLFYDHARYYDPAIGQFAQADTYDAGGLNRFAYVRGNPETATDPTGHRRDCQQFDDCGGGGGSTSGGCQSENCGTPPPPTPAPPPPSGCWTTHCGGNGGCYSNCGGSSLSQSHVIYSNPCIDVGCATHVPSRLCDRIRDCEYGSDPGGLWGLLGGLLGNPQGVIVNAWAKVEGNTGVQWLLNRLQDVKNAGDSYWQGVIASLSGTGVVSAGIALAFPVSVIVTGPVAIASAVSALYDAQVNQRFFDDMMNQVIGQVGHLEDQLANGDVKNPANFEIAVTAVPATPNPIDNWQNENFVVDVFHVDN